MLGWPIYGTQKICILNNIFHLKILLVSWLQKIMDNDLLGGKKNKNNKKIVGAGWRVGTGFNQQSNIMKSKIINNTIVSTKFQIYWKCGDATPGCTRGYVLQGWS